MHVSAAVKLMPEVFRMQNIWKPSLGTFSFFKQNLENCVRLESTYQHLQLELKEALQMKNQYHFFVVLVVETDVVHWQTGVL